MSSEIRVNKINNRAGLGTVEYTPTGIIVSGIVTAYEFDGNFDTTPGIVVTGIATAAGIDQNMNESTILASMEVTYLSQLSHPTPLIVGHRIIRVGNKSYDLIGGIFRESGSVILCHAYFKLVSAYFKLV